jgi:hypothetical protein
MDRISFTLVSEGTSDKALIPHLKWLLEQNGVSIPIDSEWADWRFLPNPPKGLSNKIKTGIELYPCDILFVHRDSDREPFENRKAEINQAIMNAFGEDKPPFVCVIPVKMLEAWLLFDESAIRRASGNPFGKVNLDLPKIKHIEGIGRPKELLEELIIKASELQGRHLRKLNLSHCKAQISQNIEDFSLLRGLSAFQELENDIMNVVNSLVNL